MTFDPGDDRDHQEPAGPAPLIGRSAASLRRSASSGGLLFTGVVCVLLVSALSRPDSTLLLIPLLPVPYALVGLGFGAMPGILGGVVLGAASAAASFDSLRVGEAIGSGVLVAGAVVLVGSVTAACGLGRRFQTRPFAAVAAAWTITLAAALLILTAVDGPGHVQQAIARVTLSRVHQELGDAHGRIHGTVANCARGGAVDGSTYCSVLHQLDHGTAWLRRHVYPAAAVALPLYALVAAAITLWAARLLAVTRGLPMQRRRSFAVFEVHFGVAYATALGIVIWIATRHVEGSVGLVLRTTGAVLGVTGVALVLLQGAAVMSWWLRVRGLRTWLRVLFWVLAFTFAVRGLGSLAYVCGFFALVSMLETMLGIRRRIASRMAPPE